jgi:hypothetical protein
MDTGEVPGYEFEVPRGPRPGPRHASGHDPLRQARYLPPPVPPSPAPPSPVRGAGRGVLSVMRKRNWLLGLAAPILAAVAVGIALVVVAGGGGNGGTAPSALAAGFPPARVAGQDFTGAAPAARVVLTSVAASAATQVAAGGANGTPALWVSTDGGTGWTRASVTGPATLTRAGSGQLAAVAHGASGWLAVGTTLSGAGGPLVATSADARSWTATALARLGGGNAVAAGVAAGHGGYVIVGHRSASLGSEAVAAAWYAPGLAGWRSAPVAGQKAAAAPGTQMMNAVTATAGGFTAVGAAGTRPAAWVSADGRSWRQTVLPAPAAAERAALDYVAASGRAIVAAGTEFTAAGASRPFAEVSADAGATWAEVALPVPAIGPGTGTTVTALTAAGGGFTAAGTYVTQAGPEVVLWTLAPGAVPGAGMSASGAWTAVTPQGIGLAGQSAENAITALTAEGATLTGVGFTARLTSGMPGAQQPTLWQSPFRY